MTARPSRTPWLLSVLFGLGTIALVFWFGGVIPNRTCSGPLPDGVTSLTVYQMAKSPADVEAVFGAEGDPCRAEMVAKLDEANTMDLRFFIATYGLFLAFFLIGLIRNGGGVLPWAGLVALIAGLGFDVLETWTQLQITQALPGTAAQVANLSLGATGKFAALALATILGAFAIFARSGSIGKLAAVVIVVAEIFTVVALFQPNLLGLMALGSAVAWLLILLYSVTQVARPS